MALDSAHIGDFVEMQTIAMTIHYNQMDAVTRALSKCNGSILNKAFNEQVALEIILPKNEVQDFINRFK
ncbi:MAG TPA: DUF1949 domain-containing protein, partial [Methylotenera sp.]|nr:DUF1949 domain-containing protein [Methylotenera sp.]